ncbi:Rv0361 family membrane protein [Tsukamurella strandjordii]|uniref:Uncharacterized protein n=1 Tax=Tsukamurella strandjordii TaxID=147577 RepID=A0AA90NJT2_9ACTN|nr:hypothetical protein [Tsukamurella strandjordii]MDP0400273.1 hypothetical protein [Tsukamurella strandjordii]
MRPTDPRELLYPVLPPQTYRELGIAPPQPPRTAYGQGGPVSAAGTPFLTGSAVTGTPVQGAPVPAYPAPAPGTVVPDAAGRAPSGPGPVPPAPAPNTDRTIWIIAGATALIIAIIVGATWIILSSRGSDDETQIRAVIEAEIQAQNKRDLNALIATRCASDQQLLRQQFTQQTFAAEVDSLIGPGGSWKVTVNSVSVDADAGTATAEETIEPIAQSAMLPQTITDTATLRRESGEWRVCVSSAMVR